MPLSAGDRLGPYQVLSPIGAGGMGEVYKARDTRLDRTVAVKVLPEHIATREDLRARFEREARAVASLNHPHICTLHDIGNQDGVVYMVMEYLEGETLAARINKGGAPARSSTEVGHADRRRTFTLTRDGVKVLDFGLAKSTSKPGPDDATLTAALTPEGTVMGTPQYMSPEQFEGKEADARSDIWAFGAVLYEMVTGRRAFQGKSYASLLGAILAADPAPMTIQPFTPAWLERLVRRCLAKDPEDRYYSMHDVVLDLRTPFVETTTTPTNTNRWPLALAAVMTAATVAVSVIHFREIREQPHLFKLTVLSPEKAQLNDQYSIPAVSPDGRRVAFVATTDGKEDLWVRDLDSLAARALPGSSGAKYPFWSPDSRAIAFFADDKLKRVDLAGGPALNLCDSGMARGGTWSKKGIIVWGGFGTGLFSVPAAGGTPSTAAMKAPGAGDQRFPWFLPDGRHYLFTETAREIQESGVYVADLESKGRKRLIAEVTNAVYSPPGYLLFVRDGTLMAQHFDADKLELAGDAVPVAGQVDSQATQAQNQFSVSQNGVLAYTAGRSGAGSILHWFDRSGRVTGMLGAPNAISWGAISPDGNTVAVQRVEQGLRDIWLHDLARGAASRFTFGPGSKGYPAWSPDGRFLSFFSQRDGIGRPYKRATSGTGQDEVLSVPLGEPPGATVVEGWSSDGRYAVLRVVNPKTLRDIWVLSFNQSGDLAVKGTPLPYLLTEFDELYGRISPDGRWLAYTSNESKRNEIYVQSFPTPGGKLPVSTNGGERSVWRRDGKELYFVSPDGKMMAAEVKSGAKFEVGVPKPLFNVRLSRGMDPWFDVTKDGRFLIPVQLEQSANVPITVVVNWQAGLNK